MSVLPNSIEALMGNQPQGIVNSENPFVAVGSIQPAPASVSLRQFGNLYKGNALPRTISLNNTFVYDADRLTTTEYLDEDYLVVQLFRPGNLHISRGRSIFFDGRRDYRFSDIQFDDRGHPSPSYTATPVSEINTLNDQAALILTPDGTRHALDLERESGAIKSVSFKSEYADGTQQTERTVFGSVGELQEVVTVMTDSREETTRTVNKSYEYEDIAGFGIVLRQMIVVAEPKTSNPPELSDITVSYGYERDEATGSFTVTADRTVGGGLKRGHRTLHYTPNGLLVRDFSYNQNAATLPRNIMEVIVAPDYAATGPIALAGLFEQIKAQRFETIAL